MLTSQREIERQRGEPGRRESGRLFAKNTIYMQIANKCGRLPEKA